MENKIPDICGLTSAKQFAYYDRDLRSLRTYQTTGSSDSELYSGTVPKMGYMSGGRLFELQMSEPPTNGSGCSLPLLPTPRTTDSQGGGRHGDGGMDLRTAATTITHPERFGLIGRSLHNHEIEWGKYEPAVRRWENVLGRPAPAPTEPNKFGNPRLTAAFDEWVMGIPEGWVTETNIPHGAKIKLLGNGVVYQQGELALRQLLSMEDAD